ncbi:hypothetical protein TSO352_12475 [Azospirillum sp. TSO35-2]|nr:hypothetical protein TSO352_12475 [Azospirillum sp. TSO35-2]
MMYGGKPRRAAAYASRKRVFDLIVTIIAVVVLLPLFLVCASLVKLEHPSAPIFFGQQRTGLQGRRFTMYKFRTMVPNAEQLKKELSEKNELTWPDFKIKNDPRITKVGYYLRRLSLDEIPQLYSVLKGDMSLVGPRPTSFPADTYHTWQLERLAVRPGITGLAQVIDRDGMLFEQRVRYDVTYVRNCCLLLDLLIIYRTAWALARGH